jgi:methylated-DNA-[protein]-cysteine S-methyltransferase
VAVRLVRYVAPGWGVGELWLAGETLVQHELPRPSPTARSDRHPLADRMRSYFRGARVAFDEVELDLGGLTLFQRAVTAALRQVPYGEVVTYGELAALAGHPNAQRAAGTFCSRNRFPLVLPCHRVVGANGLGAYGSLGLEYKRRLLALEGWPP